MISVPVTVAVENVSVPVTVNVADNSISMSLGANYHSYPPYADGYEFTPSREAQIIETAGKALDKNITITPIPNNYGLITWNGSFLTVS